jgi:phosphate transport system substrate-binding protein
VQETKEYSPVARRIRVVCTAAAMVPLTFLAAACGSSGSSSSDSSSSPSAASSATSGVVSLSETGSTLMFPLFGAWQTAYNKTVTDVNITTAGTGSGTGIADAASGVVTMGGSDAYLSSAEVAQNHNLLNIPLAVSSAMINYNVPGVKAHLKFNGKVLAQIYSGKITNWNDPAIKALNPGVTLPSMKIVTLHRSDSSGTTFIFVSYLSAQDPADWSSSLVGTTVSWPSAPGALGETGNGGMVQGCTATKGCIAYIGTSYLTQTTAAHLGEAQLANKAGKYTLPTTSSVQAALASFEPSTPANETQSLINTSAPTGYPIINYEYVIVDKKQPSAAVASALKAFLNWTLTTGSTSDFLGPVNFQPLSSRVKGLSQAQISSISG